MSEPILPKVFIIILSYNSRETLKKCLSAAFNLEYPNFEVVLVDNDSKDGSLEFARQLFSRAHIIKSDHNVGCAAGNNLGIRFALEKMADYVILLNPDTEIEKETLTNLIAAAEHSHSLRGGIFSPVILQGNDKSIWFSGGEICWLTMKAVHSHSIPASIQDAAKPWKTEYVSGCAMLIKKEVFQSVGLFDEDYFLYYEDADFCLRAGKKGLFSYVVPSAQITHFETSESPGWRKKTKTYWLVISGLIFFKKHTPLILKPWIYFYVFARKMKNSFDIMLGRNLLASEVRRAYRDYAQWNKKFNSPS